MLVILAASVAEAEVAQVLSRVRVALKNALDQVLLALAKRLPHVGHTLNHYIY